MHVLSSKTYKSPCSGSLSSISNLYSNPKQPPAFTKILNLACSLFFNVFVNSLIFWWFFFFGCVVNHRKTPQLQFKISNFLLQFSVYLNTRIAYVDFPSTLLCFVGSCHSWKVKVFLNENWAECEYFRRRRRIGVDFRIAIDLYGSTIDYKELLIRSSFVISNNPNSEQSCGCGSSFSSKAI